jgi:hypothetical protein
MQIKRYNAQHNITDKIVGQKELIEKIRMNTERDRINRYRDILDGPVKKYYSLVDEFSDLIKNYEIREPSEHLNGISLKKQR